MYQDCIPLFINTWRLLFPDIKIVILFINNTIPPELSQYSDHLVLFDKTPTLSSAFVSQFIRLLYPALIDSSDGVMITDIDMIPMNRDYYIKPINDIPTDRYINMRKGICGDTEIAMCYNIAPPYIWSEIFNIHNETDIVNYLTNIYNNITYDGDHGGIGWNTDQLELSTKVNQWRISNNAKYIELTDQQTAYNRLDRYNMQHCFDYKRHYTIKQNILNSSYTDYHICRPVSNPQYNDINNKVYELLKQSNNVINI